MPGSGYIIETTSKPAQRASSTYVGSSDYGQAYITRQNRMLFPFYRKSFRSGSAYDIMASKPDTEVRLNEPSLLEALYAIRGMDIGHEYKLQRVTEIKSSLRSSGGSIVHLGYNTYLPKTFLVPEYTGSLNCGGVLNAINTANAVVTDSDLIAQGTRCIAQTNPLKPSVTLATSLTELVFEGLPSIIGKTILTPSPKKADLIRNAAGEHLNFMFGVTPVVSDIVGIVKILRQGNKIVEQWLKNDGRKIRRRRTWDASLPAERYDRILPSGYLQVSAIGNNPTTQEPLVMSTGGYLFDGMAGWLESSVQTNIRYSFNSSFEYHLSKIFPEYPEPLKEMFYGSSSDEQIARAMLEFHQYGLDPKTILSADTVWNTLPFSWLLDWFVNIGDLVSNVTAFRQHGLMLDYGYMSTIVERRFTANYRFVHQGSVISGVSALNSVYQRRIRATPFGFGSTFDGLSSSQSSILAALATSFSGK